MAFGLSGAFSFAIFKRLAQNKIECNIYFEKILQKNALTCFVSVLYFVAMSELRDYQSACIDKMRDAIMSGERCALVQMATGLGKTVTFSDLIRRHLAASPRNKVLVIVHRTELAAQTIAKLKDIGIEASLEQAKSHGDRNARVVVSSIQTISQKKRLHNWKQDHFTMIVIDECHHVAAKTWKRTIKYFDKAIAIGFTATPTRTDKEDISEILGRTTYSYPLHKAILDDWLVPPIPTYLDVGMDIKDAIDDESEMIDDERMGEILEEYLNEIVDKLPAVIGERTTLIFTPLVRTSQRLVELLNNRGIESAHVDGTTPKSARTEITDKFSSGEVQVVSNAQVFTEGYDNPRISAVVILRPTDSLTCFVQMVGRGLRPAPVKKDCLIIQPRWDAGKHNICNAHILEIPPLCREEHADGCDHKMRWHTDFEIRNDKRTENPDPEKEEQFGEYRCINPACKHGIGNSRSGKAVKYCPKCDPEVEMVLINIEHSPPFRSENGKMVHILKKTFRCPQCMHVEIEQKEVLKHDELSRLTKEAFDPWTRHAYEGDAIERWHSIALELKKKWSSWSADDPPSQAQVNKLSGYGVSDAIITRHANTRWRAHLLIRRMMSRDNANYVRPKDIDTLIAAGCDINRTLITRTEMRAALKSKSKQPKTNNELTLMDL